MRYDEKKRVAAAADRLVTDVEEKTARSSGNRAALRRSLGRDPGHPQSRHAIALVSRHIPDGADEAVERAFYAVAALIAAQPRQSSGDPDEDGLNVEDAEVDQSTEAAARAGDSTTKRGSWSLGAALARAAVPPAPLKFETVEARLHLLCRQRVNGLHRQLPRLVAQLWTIRVPIDWRGLTVDLARWDSDADLVAKQWLEDYYRTYYRLTAAKKNPKDDSVPTDPSEDQ